MMPNMNMMNMMKKFFTFPTDSMGASVHNLWFKGFSTSSVAGFVMVCIGAFSITIIVEVITCFRDYLKSRSNLNPLTYAKTEENIRERSPLLSSIIIPATIGDIRYRKIKFHIAQSFVHIIHLLLAYMLMLSVMTYNGWIFISVCMGHGLGYLVFATYRNDYLTPRVTPPPMRGSQIGSSMEQLDPGPTGTLLHSYGAMGHQDQLIS